MENLYLYRFLSWGRDSPTVAHAQDIYGDVNSDGEVNIADVNAIIVSNKF